jgi:hypothetical protein
MIEIPMDIFTNTSETALVCGFTHENGGWRLVAVTSAASQKDPSTLMTKEHGSEPQVTFYGTVGGCDEAFIAYTDMCLTDGYEFMGQVEAALPPLVWESAAQNGVTVVKDWADKFLRSASFELERENEWAQW